MTAHNFQDITNERYGRLTVLSRAEDRHTAGGKVKTRWKCKCDCGKILKVDGEGLRNGHTRSCGCLLKDNKGQNYKDLSGQKFGRLTVIRFLERSERTTRGYNWLCVCDCGKEVKVNASKLKSGLQKSCGCLKEEMKFDIGDVNRKYTHSNKRLYGVYKSMLNRCYDKKHREYKNYGERGIKVCDEWLGEFGYDKFAEWAFSSGYDENAKFGDCTLDRKDVDKDYSKDNCRWISNAEQQSNRRDNVKIPYNGETHTMTEWARILNVPKSTLINGIKNSGKDIEYYAKTYKPQK